MHPSTAEQQCLFTLQMMTTEAGHPQAALLFADESDLSVSFKSCKSDTSESLFIHLVDRQRFLPAA